VTNLKTKVIVVGLCAILVAGCSVLSPQPDRSRFYILTPVSDGGRDDRPARLDQRRFAAHCRGGPSRFSRLPSPPAGRDAHRAQPDRALGMKSAGLRPLDKNFIRVLSENLSTLLNTYRIEKYPWPLKTRSTTGSKLTSNGSRPTARARPSLSRAGSSEDGMGGKILYASETTTGRPRAPTRPAHRRP